MTLIVAVAVITSLASISAAGADNRDSGKGMKKGHDRDRANAFVVDTTMDTLDAYPGDGTCADDYGKCSLRAAVQEANATKGSNTIELMGKTYALTIMGADEDAAMSGDLDITDNVKIHGNGAVIDLDGFGDRAFDVMANTMIDKVTIMGASLTDGSSGGAIRSTSMLTLDRFTATGNTVEGAGASGGAVFNDGGKLTITNGYLADNSATRAGGAIEANAGMTTVKDSVLNDNRTGAMPGNGGALHLTGEGTVKVKSSTVSGNTAAAEGGGLWNSGSGTMEVSKTDLTDNVVTGTDADQGGGALFNNGGSMMVSESSIAGNTAVEGSGSGGGIFNNDGYLSVSKTSIKENMAARAGGGIEVLNGDTRIELSVLSYNETGPSPGNGGGLHASGTMANVTIDQTTVTYNVAAREGGGLWAGGGDSMMTATRSNISYNTANGSGADDGGGGLFNQGGMLTVADSSIMGNTADMGSGSGGGILNLGTLDVQRTTISGNSAARAGGGIESNAVMGAGDATLSHVTLTNNSTGPTPGNGGGMHVTGSSITTMIDSSTVTGNEATKEGGGLWNVAGATMTVTDTTITDNEAPVADNVFQSGDGGNFTVDGMLIEPGDNDLSFP